MSKSLLSVIFSFRNEEDNINELVSRIDKVMGELPDWNYELIFVNDDSTDSSLAILRDLQKSFPIKILNMARRFGVGPCVLAGFQHSQGQAVIYMDADLQDPPELFPLLLKRFEEGIDVVHTTRTSREGEPLFKLWITDKAYRLINAISDIPLVANTGDYKLLSRRVVDQIVALPEIDSYIRGLSIWVGFAQDFVPYKREARYAGTTHFPLLSSGPILEFIRGMTSFSSALLYFSFLMSLAAFFIAILLITYALVTKFTGNAVPGTAGIIICITFFSALVLLSNGLMGLYIARIFNQVKGRPRYVLKDIIKHND